MSESAATYLERRTATACARVTAIVRTLPERLAATPQREQFERWVVGHPWLALGGTFAATTLISRSVFSPASEEPARDATPPSSHSAESPARPANDSHRHTSHASVLGALFTPLAAFASRALLEGFFTDAESDARAQPDGRDSSNPPEADVAS